MFNFTVLEIMGFKVTYFEGIRLGFWNTKLKSSSTPTQDWCNIEVVCQYHLSEFFFLKKNLYGLAYCLGILKAYRLDILNSHPFRHQLEWKTVKLVKSVKESWKSGLKGWFQPWQ